MVSFFDLVYSVKKSFDSLSQLENVNKQCSEIQNLVKDKSDNLSFSDDEIQKIGLEFDKIGILNIDLMHNMRLYLDPNFKLREEITNTVKEFYDYINGVNFDDENKVETYKDFLSMLINSNGAVVRGIIPEPKEDDKKISNTEFEDFKASFNELKKLEPENQNLYHLLHFCYENDFNKLNYNLINSRDKSIAPKDIKIVQPIIREMFTSKAILKARTDELYEIILNREYKNDSEFVSEIESANKKTKIITDNTVDFSSLKQSIENIKSIKQNIFMSRMDKIVDSKELFGNWVSDETKKILGEASISSAYEELKNADKSKKIKDNNEIEIVEKGINDAINHAIERCSNEVFAFESEKIEYQNLIDGNGLGFKIEVIKDKNDANALDSITVVNLIEIIDKWKAFMESNLYSQFGDKLAAEINNRLESSKFELKDAQKKYLKDDAQKNVLKIVRRINLSSSNKINLTQVFNSIKEFIKEEYITNNTDLNKFYIINAVLSYLRYFFQIPFNGNTSRDKAVLTNKSYYDAACTIIYFSLKNNDLSESYHNSITEIMFYKNRILFEKSNWLEYFNKLYDKFKFYMSKRKEGETKNILTFVYDQNFDKSSLNSDSDADGPSEEVKDLSVQIKELTKTNTELEKNNDQLKTDVKEISKKMSKVKKDLSQTKKDLKQSQKDLDDTRTSLKKKEEEIDDLKKKDKEDQKIKNSENARGNKENRTSPQ